MKKASTYIIICIFLIGIAFAGMHSWIASDVKQNIELAKQQYPGTAEEALIAFLQDENRSFHDRTHKAIWTLGQIRSQKALPILKSIYINDPEGETCRGNHNSMLCQYEINKAIISIEKNWLFSQARFNK